LGVLRRIAETVAKDHGEGAVRGAVEAAAKRIVGFEPQFGPFAVAPPRLIAKVQALMGKPPLPDLRLYIADALGIHLWKRRGSAGLTCRLQFQSVPANKVKREERITVVIGNPPYQGEGREARWLD
jgi:hypothetical protein